MGDRSAYGMHPTYPLSIHTLAASAIEVIEGNFDSNKACFGNVNLKPGVLDWEEPEFSSEINAHVIGEDARPFDLIVWVPAIQLPDVELMYSSLADVTYNTAMFPALIMTLKRLVDVPNPPVVLLAYKERDPAERTLWEMSAEIGIVLKKLAIEAGAGGEAVEIWAWIKDT